MSKNQQNNDHWVVEEGHVIVPAFESEGVQYYQMKDIFNSFAGRALDAMAIYEKWSMRTSPEFMTAWLQGLENTINANPIKITEVAEMINIMRERINFALPTESIIWELAAVAFFDRNESPYRYDPEYAKEKIVRWKKDIGLPAFFFATPLRDMVSLPDLSEAGLKNYLTAVEAVSGKQLEKVLSHLSSSQRNQDFLSVLG
jgi:hypothetical protein